MKTLNNEASFTLIELVIVIGILAVLAVVVIIVLNPSEFLKQSRDSTRMSDLQTINKSLGLYQADGGSSFGSSNTVYVSIPSSQSNCSDLGLPALPSNWFYACSDSTNYRKVNGNGWIPVNLTSITFGSTLDTLPIDPINTTSSGNYYTYVIGGSWNLTAFFESEKYKMGGSNDKTSKDSGSYPELYEIGTNLTLLPVSRDPFLVGYWKFNETSGTLYDSSGHGNNGTQSGGVTYGAAGKVGNALSFDGMDDYILLTSYTPTGTKTIEAWVKPITSDVAHYTIFGDYLAQISAGGGSNYLDHYNNSIYLHSTGTVTIDAWNHVAYVFDQNANTITFYINGQASGISNSPSFTNVTNFIGIWHYTSFEFNGLIDDVRIYNRALSAAEIAAIYNATR